MTITRRDLAQVLVDGMALWITLGKGILVFSLVYVPMVLLGASQGEATVAGIPLLIVALLTGFVIRVSIKKSRRRLGIMVMLPGYCVECSPEDDICIDR